MRVVTGEAKGRKLKSPKSVGTRPIMDRVKTALFDIISWRIRNTRFLDLFAGTGSVGIEALSRGAQHATFIEMDHKIIKLVRENLQITQLTDRAEALQSDAFKFLQLYQNNTKPGHSQRTNANAHCLQSGDNLVRTSARVRPEERPDGEALQNGKMRRFLSIAGKATRTYDIIYVAPPQYQGLAARALALIDSSTLVADEGQVIVQIHPKERPEIVAIECQHLILTDERRYGNTLLMFYQHQKEGE